MCSITESLSNTASFTSITHSLSKKPNGPIKTCSSLLETAGGVSGQWYWFGFILFSKNLSHKGTENLNLISESAQALLVTLSVLTTSQSCWWFPPPFCAPLSFSTFGWRLGCKHSLLLGFRGRIHSGGGLVVVGWGIVHVRSSSANVHPCKWCRRVKICQEVSPERMRIHLTCDPQDTNVAKNLKLVTLNLLNLCTHQLRCKH